MPNAGTIKTGGVYIPPHRMAEMMREVQDKSCEQYQRVSWDAVGKSINGLVDKINMTNIKNIIPELFLENLIRGRGLFCRSCIKSQMASPGFTDVFAALVAVVNTKFTEIGNLLLRRIVLQFRRAYKRNDKSQLLAATKFIAHLVNQQVAHEILALELLTVLLKNPIDDSVEVAADFVKECGALLQDLSPQGMHDKLGSTSSSIYPKDYSPDNKISKLVGFRMGEHCKLLSELTNGSHWVRIQIRVSRMWSSITKAKEEYSKNLQLLDKEDNQKQDVIPKGLLEKYKNTFDEQCVYEIENFNVIPSENNYRVINEELMILLRRDTEVRKLHGNLDDIPTHKFGFVTDNVLATRIDKLNQLTDITRVLLSVSDVTPITTRTGCQTAKREIKIKNESGKVSLITLWAEKTNLVDISTTATSLTHLPSVVLTSMIVKLYRGEFSFSSTNATKYYANVNIPELTKLNKSHNEPITSMVTTMDKQPKGGVVEDIKASRSATILTDIKEDNCSGKCYIIPVTIINVNTTARWSYLSCTICRKSVRNDDNIFKCPKCTTTVQQPINRYRLTIEVFDHNSFATVIAFDKDATSLLNMNVDDMIHLQNLENGPSVVEKIFNNLTGAETHMEFRPTTYDIFNRGKTITVSKVGQIHLPYARLLQNSVEDKLPNIIEENTSSQLTTESTVIESNSRKMKGKMKVEQQKTMHTHTCTKQHPCIDETSWTSRLSMYPEILGTTADVGKQPMNDMTGVKYTYVGEAANILLFMY